MREIKFRVWEVSKKQFIYEWDASYKRLAISFTGEVYHGGYDDVLANKEYIVQQYTGLKDKNGKEIYEGDIIKYDRHDDPVIIRWTEEGMDYTGWIFEDLFTQGGPFEVIGNIFETPELLEVK